MTSQSDVLPDEQYVLESWRQALRVLQSMDAHARTEHFKMDRWGEKTPCGTVACLAGHCALDPWFQTERHFGAEKYHAWGELKLPFDEFSLTFGSAWQRIFYLCSLDHAGVVREVMRHIARLGGEPVNPFGYGMP